RRTAADRGMGHHGRGGRGLHGLRRMVDCAVSGPRPDDRGVLLQPARRRPARYRRSAAEDVMPSVIASEAKQSIHPRVDAWIASSLPLLAMTNAVRQRRTYS